MHREIITVTRNMNSTSTRNTNTRNIRNTHNTNQENIMNHSTVTTSRSTASTRNRTRIASRLFTGLVLAASIGLTGCWTPTSVADMKLSGGPEGGCTRAHCNGPDLQGHVLVDFE